MTRPPSEQPLSDDSWQASQRQFLDELLAGKRAPAMAVLRDLLALGAQVPDLYVRVLQQALYQVGQLWERNQITVADEHMATAIAQWCVALLYAELPLATTNRGRMVIAGIQGELHQVGANMVADVLESDGWDVRFLGTDMPHDGILQALRDHQADVLGVSAAMVFSIPPLVRLVEQVRSEYGAEAPLIVLGGGALQFVPTLASDLGVAGAATDLLAARELMRTLDASG